MRRLPYLQVKVKISFNFLHQLVPLFLTSLLQATQSNIECPTIKIQITHHSYRHNNNNNNNQK